MLEFLQTPVWSFALSLFLLVWSLVWTLLSMWKAGNKKQRIWFVILFLSLMSWYLYPNIVTIIIGLFAALPILYFFILSRFSFDKKNNLIFEKWGKKKKSSKKKS